MSQDISQRTWRVSPAQSPGMHSVCSGSSWFGRSHCNHSQQELLFSWEEILLKVLFWLFFRTSTGIAPACITPCCRVTLHLSILYLNKSLYLLLCPSQRGMMLWFNGHGTWLLLLFLDFCQFTSKRKDLTFHLYLSLQRWDSISAGVCGLVQHWQIIRHIGKCK